MSVAKVATLHGDTQSFIYRIERVDGVGKPSANRYAIISGKIYASDAAKNAGDAIGDFSLDLKGAAAEAVMTATTDMFSAAYAQLKAAGQMLEGGTDC